MSSASNQHSEWSLDSIDGLVHNKNFDSNAKSSLCTIMCNNCNKINKVYVNRNDAIPFLVFDFNCFYCERRNSGSFSLHYGTQHIRP